MSLWSNTDANTSVPKFAPSLVNLENTQDNSNLLYANTTADAFIVGETIGVFGVDANEALASNINGSAGWVLRTEGSGGRAGRIMEETIVAFGSMDLDGDNDNPYVDARITISSQPSSGSVKADAGGANTLTFTVGATSTPTVSLSYQWQYANNFVWENVADSTPANTTYTGETAASLVVTPTNTDGNGAVYRVVISATGAATVNSANVTATIT
jgi:hypothetical protein